MNDAPLTPAERAEILSALTIQPGFLFSPPWLIDKLRRYEATVRELESRVPRNEQ